MKKIISLILALSMLLPLTAYAEQAEESDIAVATAEAYTETVSKTMQRKVDVLTSIDVLRGYSDGSFRLNQNITRAEFVVLCVRALGYEDLALNDKTLEATFSDTDGHWAVENIEFARTIGLIEGSGGYFYPDNDITANEAVKLAICMLGYREMAEVSGGWPDGYFNYAKELGLLKEIEGSYSPSGAVNRGFVISLMFEALRTPASRIGFHSGTKVEYLNDGETIFESVHDIYSAKGRVNATKYSDLYRAQAGTNNGSVLIEDEEYFSGKTDADNLIGYYVDLYYRMENEDSEKTIVYIAPQSRSAEIIIDANDFEDLKDGKLYYTPEDKRKNVKVEKSLLVFFNKRAFPDYTAEDFKEANGTIKLLDGDGNGAYESAFITDYRDIVLGNTSADTKKAIDYFNPSISVELDPRKSTGKILYTITRNGEESEFSKLSKLDVISVYESKDGEIIDLVAVSNVLEGVIDTVGEEDGRNAVRVDNGTYFIGKACDNNFMIGTSYIFYLNHRNEIAGFEMQKATTRFAYLLRVTEDEDDTDTITFKLLDTDGKIKLMKASKKIKIDGETKKTSREIRNALKRNENYSKIDKFYDALKASGNEDCYNYAQLIMIKSNSDDEITQIMTEKPYNNHLTYAEREANPDAEGYTEEELCDLDLKYDGLYRHNLDPVGTGYDTPGVYFTTNRVINNYKYIRYITGMNSIEGKITLTSQTKFFIVNTDISSEDKFTVSSGNAFSDGQQIEHGTIQVYNMNKANEAMAIVLVKGSSGEVSNPLFLVDKVKPGLNNDGEATMVISGLYGGEMVSYPCEKIELAQDENGNDFKRGDVIRIELIDNQIVTTERKVDRDNVAFVRSSPAELDKDRYDEVGLVYNINQGKITLAQNSDFSNRRTYNIAGSVYIYDEAEDRIYIGSSADIEDYANYLNPNGVACVYLNYGKMHQMVYYKRGDK